METEGYKENVFSAATFLWRKT